MTSPVRLRWALLSFLGILLLAAFLRFYHLDSVPNGLNQDETSLGYNAYSILMTARDEHNVRLPQNFKAFGEYKLPGYIYASTLPIKLFGLNAFGIRFASALSGMLTVVILYFLMQELFRNRTLSTTVMLLFAINPWSIFFSRAAYEVNLAAFFITLGTYLFFMGIRKQKNLFIFISVVVFALSMYTYNIARLFSPLFFFSLLLMHKKELETKSKSFFLWLVAIAGISLIPFIFGFLSSGGASSTKGTLIHTSAVVQSQLLEFRGYFIDWPVLLNKLLLNTPLLTLWHYSNNVAQYISGSFFFVNGSSQGTSSMGTTGQWYMFELPAIFYALYLFLAGKYKNRGLIFTWIALTIAVASLTREAPQATRSFILVIPVTILSGIGVVELLKKLHEIKPAFLSKSLIVACTLASAYYIFLFFASYWVRFPIYYAQNWRTGDRDVGAYLKEHSGEYDHIVVDADVDFKYTSLLVYAQIPPQSFQRGTWTPDDSEGFSSPIMFDKYEFRKIDWDQDLKRPKTLIVTNAKNKPLPVPPLITFYYPLRPVAFAVGQQIISYPIQDIAFVLVKN